VPASSDSSAVSRRLVKLDPAFRDVVRIIGPRPPTTQVPVSLRFSVMVSSVISQFLSVAAADRISQRVVILCGGLVTPENLLELSPAELRAAGLSWSKIECVREIAEAVCSGRISVRRHARLPDLDIRNELTQIKGVGPWTADMYLMWTLARPDIWPVGDYGVRAGWSVLHDLPETIGTSQLRSEGIPFDGIRSTVAWYCWQGLHLHRQKL